MDTPEEACDYDAMDHSAVNRAFTEDFLAELSDLPRGSALRVLDVGTGTARIPIELCTRSNGIQVVAADAAAHMLQLALKNVLREGLRDRIRLDQIDAKSMPYADGEFDAIMSNSIIHHIPDPLVVLREMLRVLKPGGILFVRDLMRPADRETLDSLVSTHAGDANGHQRQMFADSLHAALTLQEVQELLKEAQLPPGWARATSDRHWTISGSKPLPVE